MAIDSNQMSGSSDRYDIVAKREPVDNSGDCHGIDSVMSRSRIRRAIPTKGDTKP
jgi:hypothetical protein